MVGTKKYRIIRKYREIRSYRSKINNLRAQKLLYCSKIVTINPTKAVITIKKKKTPYLFTYAVKSDLEKKVSYKFLFDR